MPELSSCLSSTWSVHGFAGMVQNVCLMSTAVNYSHEIYWFLSFVAISCFYVRPLSFLYSLSVFSPSPHRRLTLSVLFSLSSLTPFASSLSVLDALGPLGFSDGDSLCSLSWPLWSSCSVLRHTLPLSKCDLFSKRSWKKAQKYEHKVVHHR